MILALLLPLAFALTDDEALAIWRRASEPPSTALKTRTLNEWERMGLRDRALELGRTQYQADLSYHEVNVLDERTLLLTGRRQTCRFEARHVVLRLAPGLPAQMAQVVPDSLSCLNRSE